MQSRFKRIVKFLWISLAIIVIFLAIISSIFRALTPWASQYKQDIEQHLSLLLQKPVTIRAMNTGWYWFNPVIKLQEVVIASPRGEPTIQLKSLLVGINLIKSLRHWQIQPGILYLDDLHLAIQQQDNQWTLKGCKPFKTGSVTWDRLSLPPMLRWIFSQEKIVINNLFAEVQLQTKQTLVFKSFNLTIEKHQGLYYLEGNTFLDNSLKTSFSVQGNLDFNEYFPLKSQLHAFVSINNLQLSQWQSVLRFSLPATIKQGVLSTAMWLDWDNGQFKKIQGYLNGKTIRWQERLTGHDKQRLIEFKTNILAEQTKHQWQLEFDKLLLTLDKKKWSENQVVVQYEKDTERYKLFIRQLDVRSLLKEIAPYYPELNRYLTTLTQGTLRNLQLYFKDHELIYYLVQFANLSWQSYKDVPGVENLQGVVQWDPLAGHLDIDSSNTAILVKDKPPIVIPELNVSLEWKKLSQGLRVSIERLIINHPELVVSLNALIDRMNSNSFGQIQANVQISAAHVETWLNYLPDHLLKPKLEFWLKKNIKKIPHLVAELTINGFAPDFPFDETRGEFNLKGYIEGAIFSFAPGWPLTKNADAYININKRTLAIHLAKADMHGIPVDNIALEIKPLGTGRETLLSHSIVTAKARQAVDYILHSPLQKKLSVLSILQFYGHVLLDLQLEIPLYPENNKAIVQGKINFDDNKLLIKSNLNNLSLEQLKGCLNFNQDGIVPSILEAQWFSHPLTLWLRSVATGLPYTEIKLRTVTAFNEVRRLFKLPPFPGIKGQFTLDGLLTITDDVNDLDSLTLNSSLVGLAINLPPPLNKQAADNKPLKLSVHFNPNQLVKLHADYNQQLVSELQFTASQGTLHFKNGQIHLGDGFMPLASNRAGLHINGSLEELDVHQWNTVFNQLAQPAGHSNWDSLTSINVLIKKLRFADQTYQDLSLVLEKNSNYWSILVDQESIKGSLQYYLTTNRLHGVLNQLKLPASFQANPMKSKFTINPQELPDIDLNVRALTVGQWSLGQLSIKGSRDQVKWTINELTLDSPLYHIQAQGAWSKTHDENISRVNGTIKLFDLAKILQQFNKVPMIEAKKGLLKFATHWPGHFGQLSLQQLKGKALLTLKQGRITHLNKETEEKIGLGKLLSILSLQTIPRRLKLDFTDLSEDGYSFDEFKGNFSLNQGLLSTIDSYLNGPVAYITIKGRLNIIKQLMDLDLEIYPYIAASLPVVATIAGGPIAGLATWVASQLINQGVQKIKGYSYKISGPWQQPVIQQLKFFPKK